MATYKIDTTHSEVEFKIRHLMITNVTGRFTEFDGTFTAEKHDFSDAKINFEATVNSINTNNEQRDTHLKSPDFFDAESFPKINFTSSSVTKTGDDDYKLVGDLTIKGTTKQVELNVTHGGHMVDPWGQSKTGFEVTGKFNRKDFGLTWNAATETGGIVVSDEVKLQANVQFVKQA